jgi:hypothetical protein
LSSGRNVQNFVSWIPQREAGNTILKSENTKVQSPQGEILYKFRINVDGTIRITVSVQTSGNHRATVRVRRNGARIGKVAEDIGNRERTRSKDFSGWHKGDIMEIEVTSNQGSHNMLENIIYLRNLKIGVGGVSQGSFSGINANLPNHAGSQVKLSDGRSAQEYVNSNQKSSSASVSTLNRRTCTLKIATGGIAYRYWDCYSF